VPKTGAARDSSAPYVGEVEPGSTVTVVRRTIHEKGTKKTESKAQVNRTDSAVMHKSDSAVGREKGTASVKKTQVEQSKTVKRSRFLPGFFWLLIVLVIGWLIWRYYLWKKKGIKLFEWGHNKNQT
jgi:hypothetical protein